MNSWDIRYCIKNIIRKEYAFGNSLMLKSLSFWLFFFLNWLLETPERMDYIGNVVRISYRDTLPSTASTSACSFACTKLVKLDFPVLAFSGCLQDQDFEAKGGVRIGRVKWWNAAATFQHLSSFLLSESPIGVSLNVSGLQLTTPLIA